MTLMFTSNHCVTYVSELHRPQRTQRFLFAFRLGWQKKLIFTSTGCVIAGPVVKSRAELYTLTFTLALHTHLHIYHLASFCMYKNRRSKNSSAVTHFRTSFFSFNIIYHNIFPTPTAPPWSYTFISYPRYCAPWSSGPGQ